MIANIRIRDNGYSNFLCELDLMCFSEEEVRERMRERGIRDDTFFVCGFSDWGVDTEMSLALAYGLKRAIQELYDGDESIVIHLLKNHVDVRYVLAHYYRFISKDDEDKVARYLLENTNIAQFMITKAIESDVLLWTEKGYYFSDSEV